MINLKFSLTHEWVSEDQHEVTVGITDHAQQLLGDMVYVELPKKGACFAVGDELGVVESVKAASDFFAPISGEVTAVNDALSAHPELVNQSPYGAGWLIKMKPAKPEEFDKLLNAEQYETAVSEGA